MEVLIEVNTGNAAFENPEELYRVLNSAAVQAHNMVNGAEASGILHDINGNTVGRVHIGDSFLEQGLIVKKVRRDEKRKWFEKVKSREFWLALVKGADGVEGIEYAEEVYGILRKLFALAEEK